LNDLGESQKVVECCDRILALDENDVAAWINKSIALVCLAKYEKAVECCDRILALDENNVKGWIFKGYALNELGESQNAITCYKKSLSIEENDEVRKELENIIKKQNQSQKENTTTESEDNESQWIEITMQFPGKCKECKKDILVGDRELWKKGEGVKHVKCNYEQNEMHQK
jgi:tetratricopeptide (TPR) repeat protein